MTSGAYAPKVTVHGADELPFDVRPAPRIIRRDRRASRCRRADLIRHRRTWIWIQTYRRLVAGTELRSVHAVFLLCKEARYA